PPKLDEIGHRTVAELKAWLQPQLASGPLEVGIVGDFDPALATDAVARTLGALPARAPAASLAEQRRVVFPPKPFAETVQFQGTKGVAVIMLAWPVADAPRYPAYFHAHIAAAILESRVTQKLRSEMGETYSPGVALATNDSFTPSVAFLRCTVEAMPERATQVAAAAREVAATLVREGATAEEFERARRPLVRTTETGLRHNGWWSDVVIAAQSDPAYGEGWTGALATYETATLDQINSALRRWLAPERLCELVVQPAK
ncbi:MAG: insulinase family protein, partial [Verrucomicrobiota bacterium]